MIRTQLLRVTGGLVTKLTFSHFNLCGFADHLIAAIQIIDFVRCSAIARNMSHLSSHLSSHLFFTATREPDRVTRVSVIIVVLKRCGLAIAPDEESVSLVF